MRTLFQRVLSVCVLIVSMIGASVHAAQSWSVNSDLDYLPANQNYDPQIPLPEEVLGYPVGTWHVRHDQLVAYMYRLAEASDRITIRETGRTHESRPLVLLTITAPENHQNVPQMREQHLARIKSGEAAPADAPLFLYMGYSVHGNEPSGANAALLVAYHLAASRSQEVESLLKENVVLLDPSLNPDGLSRFAQWANMHKGYSLVADKAHREHREHWPSGRTNHYWFDLNRDWLLLTHPESKARITQFHQWRPHVLTDFHEMGTDSTYFFQPGIPSRKNPWTPDTNVTLTNALGDFHAQALDEAKQLYFTQEAFDDFYYGKGSTYPDAHGSVGILFEQASSRGHLQDSINGELSFPATIQNQFTTSLSTFAGSVANKAAILAYQQQFYRDTRSLIDDDKVKGYLLGVNADQQRLARAADILARHQIEFSMLAEDNTIDGVQYTAGKSIYVPVDQPQYRLLKSLFSERKSFLDNTFYDVSNWNIALAFNFDYTPVNKSQERKLALTDYAQQSVDNSLSAGAYAYAFDWQHYQSPALLQALLSEGVQARVAGASFSAKIKAMDVERDFAAGTVVIPSALAQPDNLHTLIQKHANQQQIPVYEIRSGLTAKGIDLGSRRFAPVDLPKVLMVGGKGTSQYEVGEIWHYLDTRIGIPASLVDLSDLANLTLSSYTHIIFANGRYSSVGEDTESALTEWVKQGGTLIGQKNAVKWFSTNNWIANKVKSNDAIDDAFETEGLGFGDRQALAAKKLIAGAVYRTQVDLSHPLMFGYSKDRLPMFKTANTILQENDELFTQVAKYTAQPLVAGYSSDELQALVANSAAIVVKQNSKGRVIAFVDNIHFRGYWDGTNKLMANSLFMSPLM